MQKLALTFTDLVCVPCSVRFDLNFILRYRVSNLRKKNHVKLLVRTSVLLEIKSWQSFWEVKHKVSRDDRWQRFIDPSIFRLWLRCLLWAWYEFLLCTLLCKRPVCRLCPPSPSGGQRWGEGMRWNGDKDRCWWVVGAQMRLDKQLALREANLRLFSHPQTSGRPQEAQMNNSLSLTRLCVFAAILERGQMTKIIKLWEAFTCRLLDTFFFSWYIKSAPGD